MDFEDYLAIGLPMGFYQTLRRESERPPVERSSLTEFLAYWKYLDYVKLRPDGEEYMHFGDFAQLRSVLADIGGTIGSVSNADPVQLMQLSNVPQEAVNWQNLITASNELLELFSDSESDRPRSVHHMVTASTYARAQSFFPNLDGAKPIGELGATEISFDDIADKWISSANFTLHLGIAIAKHHTDFYYSMEEFNRPIQLRGGRRESRWPFKREYHLAQCRLWANMCRPDLAHLLSGD